MIDAREYLREVSRLEKIYYYAHKKLEHAKDRYGEIKTLSYEKKEGTSGNINTKSPQEIQVNDLIELEEKCKSTKLKYEKYRSDAFKQLVKLNGINYDILYARYFPKDGDHGVKKWKYVAKELHYQVDTIKKYHTIALTEFQKVLNDSFPQ